MATRVKVVLLESKKGGINKEIIEWLSRELNNYSFKTEYESEPILITATKEIQYPTLLEELRDRFEKEVEENKKILGITDLELKDEEKSPLGVAETGGGYALVSTGRLSCNGTESFRERLLKESLHELGHTLGLEDHREPDCVMNYSSTIEDVDKKNKEYCSKCRKNLNRKKSSLERKNPFAVVLSADIRDITESRFINGWGFPVLLVGSIIYGCLLIVYFLLNMLAGDTWLGLLGYILIYLVTVCLLGICYGTLQKMSKKIKKKVNLNYDDKDLRFFLRGINWMRYSSFSAIAILIPLTLTFFAIWLAFKLNWIGNLSLFGRNLNQSGFLTLFPSWFFSGSTILGVCAFIFLFIAYNRFTVTSYLPNLIDRFYEKIINYKKKKRIDKNSSQEEIEEALSEFHKMSEDLTGMLPKVSYDCIQSESEAGPWMNHWWKNELLERESRETILTSELLMAYCEAMAYWEAKLHVSFIKNHFKANLDYSFLSLGYCKALEIELTTKLVKPARKILWKELEIENKKGNEVPRFLFQDLEKIAKLYQKVQGNQADKKVRNFFTNNISKSVNLTACFQNGQLHPDLDEIRTQRNGLAHTEPMEKEKAETLNKAILMFFDEFFKDQQKSVG